MQVASAATVACVVTSPPPTSSASAATRDALEIELLGQRPSLEHGLLSRSVDDVAGQFRILVREVGAEVAPRLSVRASALGRDQPRQQVRRLGAGARARRRRGRGRRPARAPSRISGVTGVERLGEAGGLAETRRKVGLPERGERGPAAEDETLEERVRREPIRAVNARAGTLAGRVQPGSSVRPSRSVTIAAHRVVRRGRDRDRLDGGVEARILDRRHQDGKRSAVDRAQVEQRRAARGDRAGDDVPRRELVGEAASARRRAGAHPRRAAPR